MKQYDYCNIEEDAHIFHMWEPLKFKIKDDYQFISKNVIFNLISNILFLPIGIILVILNKILFGYKVINKENIVGDAGVVSISNHIHPMDCTMIGLVYYPRRVYFPTLQTNFKIPFIRHLIRILYAIPIPTNASQKKIFYGQINEALQANGIVQMYPEGSLWPYYEEVRNFKYGAFKMAVEANVAVQPIKFVFKEPTGIYKLYKRKKCIQAVVLEAIYPNNELDYKSRIEDLRNRTYESLKREI